MSAINADPVLTGLTEIDGGNCLRAGLEYERIKDGGLEYE